MRKVVALALSMALAASAGHAVAQRPDNKPPKPPKVKKVKEPKAKKPKKEKPGKPGVPGAGIADLAGTSLDFKVKPTKSGSLQINNFTFWIANLGDADAQNSRVEFWLSDDDILTTSVDPLAPVPAVVDQLVHSQSLGKLKAGKSKKRTVGGGLLKRHVLLPGQTLFAVVDADNIVVELDELNNVFAAPMPVLTPVVEEPPLED